MAIAAVFDGFRSALRAKSDQLECFGRYEFQAEGWLKGESVLLLDRMKNKGQIRDLDREIKTSSGKRIDLAVDLDDGRHWIELKHWFLGNQRGQVWQPRDFISDLEKEFAKFAMVSATDRAWIAVLCTTNPGLDPWASALEEFNRDPENAPWKLEPVDSPSDYPPSYFFCVLHARGIAG